MGTQPCEHTKKYCILWVIHMVYELHSGKTVKNYSKGRQKGVRLNGLCISFWL